ASATFEQLAEIGGRSHDFTFSAELASRRMNGSLTETGVVVNDADGRPVRTVDFSGTASIGASDRPLAFAARDVWQATPRLHIDGGVRVDHSRYGGAAPSGRAGFRFAFDEVGLTVLKAGYGSFVGSLPLAVPAFGGAPSRLDRSLDPETGDVLSEA